jgi:hypothetical protein
MKYLFILFTYLLIITANANNSITTLKIIGNKERIAGFQLYNDKNKLLIKKLKSTNTIQLNLKEPMRVSALNTNFIAGRQPEYVMFYLDIGKHEVIVDIDKLTFSSNTSNTNKAALDIWKIKTHYDTLMDNSNRQTFDSLYKAYHKALYNYHSKHPNSFIALSFVDFICGYFITTGLTKEEVLKLYDSLGKNLHQYPTYNRVKQQVEQNIRNYEAPYSNDSLPKPLFILKD